MRMNKYLFIRCIDAAVWTSFDKGEMSRLELQPPSVRLEGWTSELIVLIRAKRSFTSLSLSPLITAHRQFYSVHCELLHSINQRARVQSGCDVGCRALVLITSSRRRRRTESLLLTWKGKKRRILISRKSTCPFTSDDWDTFLFLLLFFLETDGHGGCPICRLIDFQWHSIGGIEIQLTVNSKHWSDSFSDERVNLGSMDLRSISMQMCLFAFLIQILASSLRDDPFNQLEIRTSDVSFSLSLSLF